MKLQVSENFRETLKSIDAEPYSRYAHISSSSFIQVVNRSDTLMQEYEKAVGINGTSSWVAGRVDDVLPYWNGEKLNEALRTHLNGELYAFSGDSDNTAYCPLENYEFVAPEKGKGKIRVLVYSVPRFAIIRPTHIDALVHLSKSLGDLEDKVAEKLKQSSYERRIEFWRKYRVMRHSFSEYFHNGAAYYVFASLYMLDPHLATATEGSVFLPSSETLAPLVKVEIPKLVRTELKDAPIEFIAGEKIDRFNDKKYWEGLERPASKWRHGSNLYWDYLVTFGGRQYVEYFTDLHRKLLEKALETELTIELTEEMLTETNTLIKSQSKDIPCKIHQI